MPATLFVNTLNGAIAGAATGAVRVEFGETLNTQLYQYDPGQTWTAATGAIVEVEIALCDGSGNAPQTASARWVSLPTPVTFDQPGISLDTAPGPGGFWARARVTQAEPTDLQLGVILKAGVTV